MSPGMKSVFVHGLRLAVLAVLALAQPGSAATTRGGSSSRQAREGQAPSREPLVTKKEAMLLQEVAALAKTDRAAAVGRLHEATTQDSSAALDFALAILLTQAERLEDAEAAYETAARKFPAFRRAWLNLGRVRLMRSRAPEAAAAFREALKREFADAELWKLLGYSYLLADSLTAAEAAYRNALALAPHDGEIAMGLAKVFLGAGRYAEALPLVEERSAGDPLNGDLWLIQANAHLAMRKEDRALEALEAARRLGALEPEGLVTVGDLYYNKGLYENAVSCYDAALETGKIGARGVLRCAEALFHVGKLDAASRYLALARERGPGRSAAALLLRGRIAEARSDLGSARKAYATALEHDPLNGEALLALGELRWRTKDYERATLTFERASRVQAVKARALVLLAQMEVELERYARAVEHLEAAQAVDPSRRLALYLEDVRRLVGLAEAP